MPLLYQWDSYHLQPLVKETMARHQTCSFLNLHPSLVISICFSYSLVHCTLQLAAPLLETENASVQGLKSQQLVRSRFWLTPFSKRAYALHLLPIPLITTK